MATALYLFNLIDRAICSPVAWARTPPSTASATRRRGPRRRRPAVVHGLRPGLRRARMVRLMTASPRSTTRREARGPAAARGRRHRDVGRPARRRNGTAGRIVLVPPAEPRTKPKACNYGLQFATGEIVTIYDAEDQPEPLQLRRAVVAFSAAARRRLPAGQALLPQRRQNLITRWFTAEYDLWFGYFLPGLVTTLAHPARRHVQPHRPPSPDLGGWDPFNVTEDADLGIRLAAGLAHGGARLGHMEEANSDSSTGSGSAPVGTRATCRRGSCTSASPAGSSRRSAPRASSVPATAARRSSRCSTLVLGADPDLVAGPPGLHPWLFPPLLFYPAMLSLVLGNVGLIYCGSPPGWTATLASPACVVPAYWAMMARRGQGVRAAGLPALVLGEDRPRPRRQTRR